MNCKANSSHGFHIASKVILIIFVNSISICPHLQFVSPEQRSRDSTVSKELALHVTDWIFNLAPRKVPSTLPGVIPVHIAISKH